MRMRRERETDGEREKHVHGPHDADIGRCQDVWHSVARHVCGRDALSHHTHEHTYRLIDAAMKAKNRGGKTETARKCNVGECEGIPTKKTKEKEKKSAYATIAADCLSVPQNIACNMQ
jgi:hypothetical protein